ncbi:MAG: chloride channel protein [Microthrixaceae bacterium]
MTTLLSDSFTERLGLRQHLPLLIVGISAGVIGAIYLGALHILQRWFWPDNTSLLLQTILLVATGILISGVTRWLGPGGNVELLVDNIHVLGAASTDKGDRALVPVSLLGISVGSTLGPEAPLVQTCGTMGTWVARRMKLPPPDVRVLTIVGMAAGFTVLFGTPVGASIFALEVLHRRGLEYYEALLPSLVGGLCGYAVFVVSTRLGMRPVWSFDPVGTIAPADLGAAVLAGVAGAAIGWAFALLVRATGPATSRLPVWMLPTFGGIGMAALGLWSPYGLTFGEHQLPDLLVPGLAASALVVAMVAKLCGAVVCLTGRWKGGFIIPLFFCGAAAGQLMANVIPWSGETVLITAAMAAAVAGVMKTPLGAPLVVAGMSGLAMLPTALIASIVALALTRQITVIGSQRSRASDEALPAGTDVAYPGPSTESPPPSAQ